MADDEQAASEAQESATERKIEVLIAEIPEELQQKAKRRVCLAMDKYDIEKDIATDVKKHFDEECEGSWHCVSGRSFGCSVTHETKHLFFFKCDQMYVLLFCSPE
ncbi:unnamed protein product [Ectocarpus sp. CCAP 1310/34]|nr:unnamed protein product [Ectocarpus sp. CCAP 1310/34]